MVSQCLHTKYCLSLLRMPGLINVLPNSTSEIDQNVKDKATQNTTKFKIYLSFANYFRLFHFLSFSSLICTIAYQSL